MKYCIFIPITLILMLLAVPVYAETMYVSNTVKITLRTGPGTDHKIIRMVSADQEVNVLEAQEEWSRVTLPDGLEGWLLTRFLSPEKPSGLVLSELEGKHQKLLTNVTGLKEENGRLTEENKQLSASLSAVRKELETVSKGYTSLKKESTEFLSLKSKYEQAMSELSDETRKAQILNDQLLQKNIKLFLFGAGILLLGFMIGLVSRKQKRRSSLL